MKTISTLTQHDFQAALAIERAAHAFPWNESLFFSNQGELYLNLKLVVNEKMVGFAITQSVLDEATLFNLAIDPAFQRKGYGNMLLSALIAELKSRHIVTLWLEVRASNHAAIALYESLGFNEVTIREHYYPTKNGHEDGIVMALTL